MKQLLRTLTILVLATIQLATTSVCAPLAVSVMANCKCATPKQPANCCCCGSQTDGVSQPCMCSGDQVPEPQPVPVRSDRDDERQLAAGSDGGLHNGRPTQPRFANSSSGILSPANRLSTSTHIALCTWQT